MKKSGRKRTSKNIPAHIDSNKLPDRVWFNSSGAGRWMLTIYDEFHKRQAKRICDSEATLFEIWQAAESHAVKTLATFTTLSNDFQQTLAWKKLSPLTQKDYLLCHQAIITRETSTGKLGEISLNKWTVGLIRNYRDKRAEESESRANKELSYIKRLFSWAYEYEKVPLNPATGIKKLTIAPRQHYAEDRDYYYLIHIARQSGYWYVEYAMELAYLCRMRMCEVLELTDANEQTNGLIIYRRKGSKTNITEWMPRLRAVWEELKQKRSTILQDRRKPSPIRAQDRHLFISERTGDKIDISTLQTAMQRLTTIAKAQAQKDGIEFNSFTFHDLKRKGISDTTASERLASAGHRSPEMMKVYDVKPDIVKPTKN
jgi:site-specific recombinase XerD